MEVDTPLAAAANELDAINGAGSAGTRMLSGETGDRVTIRGKSAKYFVRKHLRST
jgi:hypothetical protein